MSRRRKKQEVPPTLPVEGAYVSPLEVQSEELLASAEQAVEEAQKMYPQLLDTESPEETTGRVQERIDSYKRAAANMRRAYFRTTDMADELGARWEDVRPDRKRHRRVAPANALIDRVEGESDHFARGIGLYKLLWLFFIGSFAGVVVESIWCILRNGHLESRSSLVYGPFNPLYGAGAVALTLALYAYRNRGRWISFLGGALVGSALEYFCSWAQELVLGSRSWDYSNVPFNINGRICLLYSVFWGFLGVLWIKTLYPLTAKWILKLPNRVGRPLTWVVTVFFVLNMLVTCVAVGRWVQRRDGHEPTTAVTAFVDERFDDERMERIFPNMVFSDEVE